MTESQGYDIVLHLHFAKIVVIISLGDLLKGLGRMLAVGSCVVYPMHGGMRVTGIDEHDYDGEKTKYYILKALCGDMMVSVPVDSAEKLGLRQAVKPAVLTAVEAALKVMPDVKSIKSVSWNRRLQMYTNKLKSGDLVEVAGTYKLLSELDKQKRISVGERRLLHVARSIMVSEVMLVKKIEEELASAWLDERVFAK